MRSSENVLNVDQDCVSVEETARECWWSRNTRHHVEGKVKEKKKKMPYMKGLLRGKQVVFLGPVQFG